MRELALHILDILQNSIAAGATRITVMVTADTQANALTIVIHDNGRGMSPEFAARILDPFVTTRTTRRVGLGLPLLEAAASATGGRMTIDTKPGSGTSITARFGLNHIDRAPFGDIISTMVNSIVSNPSISFRYEQTVDGRTFDLDTDQVNSRLQGVPITTPSVIKWLEDYMNEGLVSIGRID